MTGQEFIIAIVGITTGTAFLGYTVAKITGLINKWMDQHHERKYGSSNNEKFEQFRRETERRLQNLEAIVVQEDDQTPALEEPKEDLTQEIEFPEEEQRQSSSSGNNESSDRNQLNNMLDS